MQKNTVFLWISLKSSVFSILICFLLLHFNVWCKLFDIFKIAVTKKSIYLFLVRLFPSNFGVSHDIPQLFYNSRNNCTFVTNIPVNYTAVYWRYAREINIEFSGYVEDIQICLYFTNAVINQISLPAQWTFYLFCTVLNIQYWFFYLTLLFYPLII